MRLSSLAFATALACAPVVGFTETPIPRAPIAAPHDRQLPLQGGQNFRDLGGYRTQDGRTVRWGLLYRSGSPANLTDADYRELERRGIRTVCDFRDRRERAAEPSHYSTEGGPQILFTDYDQDLSGIALSGPPSTWTAERARARMAALYPNILTQFTPQYRRMFGELLAGRAPLAFNCSAGKDRTGVAAALVLTALGVPRATITQDYLLTNRYLDAGRVTRGAASSLGNMPPEVRQAYVEANPAYIGAIYRVIDTHPGGAMGYLKDELGLSAADIATLRRFYTQRA